VRKIKAFHGSGVLCWKEESNGDLLVLLGKRSMNPGLGKWSIPGGSWEKKDGYRNKKKRDYKKAAMRETKEEMGIDGNYADPLWTLHIPFFHYEVFSIEYYEKILEKDIHEFSDFGWFHIKNLPSKRVFLVDFQVRALVKTGKSHDKLRLGARSNHVSK